MFVARSHNHSSCIETALGRAETVCLARSVRLTELRRRVLELVWRRHEPIGAYDLLDELKVTHRRAAPPTVYRALEFLIDQGLVHKIESLNAYIGCTRPEILHAGQFLICTRCASIGELDDPEIAQAVCCRAAILGFLVERQTIEVRGICADCSGEPEVPAALN